MSAVALDLPRVVLKSRRALPFFAGHPWVFQGAIQYVAGEVAPGAEVALFSDRQEFIARGLFNPDSNIVVRLYSHDAECPLDEAFWSGRLDEALALRKDVLRWNDPQGACRLVYSEADGLSGLIVDRYGEWLLVQFTSRALATRQEQIVALLRDKLAPRGIWLRTEKGIREAENLALADGLLWGETPPRPVFIEEHGLRFGVDLIEGQKTGFFLDQRENRRAVTQYVRGGRVLDMFCYSGGFALNLLRGGCAQEATCVDVSETALALARGNAELNGLRERMQFVKADAFKHLEQLAGEGAKFEAVILDPPKMARHRKSLPEALKGYHRLNRLAVELLAPNGILVTCSCSGHVDRTMFEEMLAGVSSDAGRPLQVLESRGMSADHPVSVHCPENNYLKCYVCRVI